MQTYKLINNTTKEETICSLVTIDGFEYYVSNDKIKKSDYFYVKTKNIFGGNIIAKSIGNGKNCWEEHIITSVMDEKGYHPSHCFKVIATNNPNIDIPKVIDEVDNIIKNAFYDKKGDFKRSTIGADDWINGLKLGYNKAKETYQFTEEDMIEFAQYVLDNISYNNDKLEEMLFTWKKQQIKTIYYE